MASVGLHMTTLNRNCVLNLYRMLRPIVLRHGRSHSIVSADNRLRYCHWNGPPFVTSNLRRFSSTVTQPAPQKETVTIHFKFSDGTRKSAKAEIGSNLLDTVISNNLDIDGYGACEGTLACSTCHIIFNQSDYAKLPHKPTDEELDMLDLAYGLTDTSRLGCQVTVTKDMDGWEVSVPGGIADARG